MRYAIVESGGKQYKAVEGQTIEVDRLAAEKGKQIELERILLMADGDEFTIGTPTVGSVQVKATVVDHLRGDKVVHFKYSPKKRIRVRGGHRQEYTRLMVDFIGKPGESRKVEKAEPRVEKARSESKTKAAKGPAKEASAKKAEKISAKKSATTKKSSATTKKSSK
jgi:large subunit ribosomal protein L21